MESEEVSSLMCNEALPANLSSTATAEHDGMEVMKLNHERLKKALEEVEKALRREESRLDKLDASKRKRPSRLKASPDTNGRDEALRAFLKRRIQKVAEAHLIYTRRVDASKESLLEDRGSKLDQKLLDRAQSILQKWRMTLNASDHVLCPDYMDEYECEDEKRGFIKYYEGVVKEVAFAGTQIPVGDTSQDLDSRTMRFIQMGERAIYVHYVGFGTRENRWIVLSSQDEIALHIFPQHSHQTTIAALEKLHPEKANKDETEAASTAAASLPDRNPRKRGKSLPRKKKEATMLNGIKTNGSSPEPRKRSRASLKRPQKRDDARENDKLINENGTCPDQIQVGTHNNGMNGKNRRAKEIKPKSRKRKTAPLQTSDVDKKGGGEPTMPPLKNGKYVASKPSLDASTANKNGGLEKEAGQQTLSSSKSSSTGPLKPAPEEGKNQRKRKRSKNKENEHDDFTWICTECKEAECTEDRDSPLMICQGQCNRPFHYPCAGLARLPPDDETWICSDCKNGRHQCVVCQEFGNDSEDVFQCKVSQCGRFFHESCLTMYNVEVELVDVEIEQPNNDGNGAEASTHIVSRPRFKCPAHQCWTCVEELPPPTEDTEGGGNCKKRGKGRRKSMANEWASKKGRVYPCLECPIAYHSSCIPPVARFHELALLCHDHATTSKLPDLDFDSSLQGEVEARADKKLEALRKDQQKKAELSGKRRAALDKVNPFFPGMRGDVSTTEEDMLRSRGEGEDPVSESSSTDWIFCLPCNYKKEVHARPPSYRHVHSLRYDPNNRPRRRPPHGESCRCKSSCDEHCLNRIEMVECIGDKNKSSGEKNPYWNCDLGPECGNRNLGLRKFAKCRPQREQGKGWGLIAVNGVKKGELVQEYTGEIIDEQTKKERLEAWARDHPNDPNYYVMYLDTGWYIDARNEANMSRFINHSCDPNCRLVRVNVGGYMRVAIYSCKDIAPGEFLSYDYQFDTKHGDKFVCRCGARNCRGTMKGGKDGTTEDGSEKKTKKQVRLEAKARFDRDKKFLEDVQKKEEERLWQVSMFVPGATTKDGTETVASGPQERYRDVALRNRVFLWRNVVRGANFAARFSSLEKALAKRSTKGSRIESNCSVDVLSVLGRSTKE